MNPDDPTFVREGRPLRKWLPELLGPDPAARRRAENVVSAIWWGAPVADTTMHEHRPTDHEAHRAAFGRAVSEILDDPAFEGERFISDALTTIREDQERVARLFDLEDAMMEGDDPVGSPQYQAHFERWKQAYDEQNAGRMANSLGTYVMELVLEADLAAEHPDQPSATDPPDETLDPLGWAITRISGAIAPDASGGGATAAPRPEK